MKHRHPLIETIVTIVCVAAVAVLTAVPSSSNAGEKNIALQDSLTVLRTAVFRYSMDHEHNHVPLMPGVLMGEIEAQLVGLSRANGSTDNLEHAEDRYYGPYLNQIPVNPVNHLQSIRSMGPEEILPVLNGTCGWVYVPATGKVYADLPGADSRRIAYLEY